MNEQLTSALEIARSNIFVPVAIFIYVLYLVVDILTSWGVYSKRTNWGKVWLKIILSAVIVGIFLAFILASPEFVEDTINKIKDFIK